MTDRDRIAAYMLKRGLSQARLAALSGYSQGGISKFLAGKRGVTLRVFRKIEQAAKTGRKVDA